MILDDVLVEATPDGRVIQEILIEGVGPHGGSH